jgi:bifunctional ADP-heptose synthase (sugar kinase/adenylyltransferase)
VAVLGAIGQDGFGLEVSRALGNGGVSSDLCVHSKELQTFTYTKLINAQTGVEDQPRVDFINTAPLAKEIESRLLDNLQMAADSYDAILISDQAETDRGGVVTPATRELLAELATVYRDRVFFADSRRRIHLFREIIVKPNREEAEAACQVLFGSVDYEALRRRVEAPLMIVTHGGDGVALVRPEGQTWIATRKVEHPVDICGAGDSFSAGCAMALAAGASPEDAARFGNLVASITIMKKGTGTAAPEEVLAAHENTRD